MVRGRPAGASPQATGNGASGTPEADRAEAAMTSFAKLCRRHRGTGQRGRPIRVAKNKVLYRAGVSAHGHTSTRRARSDGKPYASTGHDAVVAAMVVVQVTIQVALRDALAQLRVT